MKRPWFQFHLSTAIILMFVASGLLWLNIPQHSDEVFLTRGWPFPAVDEARPDAVAYLRSAGTELTPKEAAATARDIAKGWREIHAEGIAADALLSLCVLLLVGCGAEFCARRRDLMAGERWLGLSFASWCALLVCAAGLMLAEALSYGDYCCITYRIDTPGRWPTCGWPRMFYQQASYQGIRYVGFDLYALLLDAALAAAALASVVGVCEWRIRRKQRTTNCERRTTDH